MVTEHQPGGHHIKLTHHIVPLYNEDVYTNFVQDAQKLPGRLFSTVLKTKHDAKPCQMPCLRQEKHSTP